MSTSQITHYPNIYAEPAPKDAFGRDVRLGLMQKPQKLLNSKYLYDDVGSALFDTITLLPEYGLTRADTRLLRAHSSELADTLEHPESLVVELGSGSGAKARWLLAELAKKGPVTYCPVDISESALERCAQELREMQSLKVVPLATSYLAGLREAVQLRSSKTSLLVLFLGSTIGNFSAHSSVQFLREIRQTLSRGDGLYLSTDLEKNTARLLEAYNDPIGVTAAFNLNLLARINRELQGTFVLSRFQHLVRYNFLARRIEMHLSSVTDQTVSIGQQFSVGFRRGETIWTESSYKYRNEDILQLAARTGFQCDAQWTDHEWPFTQSLLKAI